MTDIVLQQRRHNDSFIEAVICHCHDHVAELVAEVLFFKCGIGKCKSERYTSVIEGFYDGLDEGLVANSSLSSAAVPYRRREHSVERRNFNSLTEEFAVMLKELGE